VTLRAYADAGYAEVHRARRAGEHALALELLALLMHRLDVGTCVWADGRGRCSRPAINATGRCRLHLGSGAAERALVAAREIQHARRLRKRLRAEGRV
jgi:hypothetical protein